MSRIQSANFAQKLMLISRKGANNRNDFEIVPLDLSGQPCPDVAQGQSEAMGEESSPPAAEKSFELVQDQMGMKRGHGRADREGRGGTVHQAIIRFHAATAMARAKQMRLKSGANSCTRMGTHI